MVITEVTAKKPTDWYSKRSELSWGKHDLAFVLTAFNLCRPHIHCLFTLQTVRSGWELSCKKVFNNVGHRYCVWWKEEGKTTRGRRSMLWNLLYLLFSLYFTCSLFSYLPRGKVLMWGIGSKGNSWKWGCEASYKGREQWPSSWALQRWSHAVAHVCALALHSLALNWSHFDTGQATGGQELKVKCWRSLMTLGRVNWWQQEDFHLKRFTVEPAQGQTGNLSFGGSSGMKFCWRFLLLSTTHTLVGNSYTAAFLHAQQQLCKTPDSFHSCELARSALPPVLCFATKHTLLQSTLANWHHSQKTAGWSWVVTLACH